MCRAPAVPHPVSRAFWLVAYSWVIFSNESRRRAYRIEEGVKGFEGSSAVISDPALGEEVWKRDREFDAAIVSVEHSKVAILKRPKE